MTHIGKSRLNRRRCTACGHPMVKGEICRLTGIETTQCAAKQVDTMRMRAMRKLMGR